MGHEADLSPTARLLSLWDHLGIGVAHVATQMPGDIAGLAAGFPSRLGGVVLCVPSRLDPAPFDAVGDRLLMICGEHGLTADVTARAAKRLGGARRVVLAGYDAPGWADVVADRTDEIARELSGFLARRKADTPVQRFARRHARRHLLSHRRLGSGAGPAAVLSCAVAMGAGSAAARARRSPSSRWAGLIWAASPRWRIAPARRPTRRCSAP